MCQICFLPFMDTTLSLTVHLSPSHSRLVWHILSIQIFLDLSFTIHHVHCNTHIPRGIFIQFVQAVMIPCLVYLFVSRISLSI